MINESFDVDTDRQPMKVAKAAGAEAARLHYENTSDGQYVPESPMDPDWEMFENTLGREPTPFESDAFQEAFEKEAKDYNCDIEMYSAFT